jgi:hypothetical protein
MRTGYALGVALLFLGAGGDGRAEHLLPIASSEEVHIRADRVEFTPDSDLLAASGNILLEVGELQVSASTLELVVDQDSAVLGGPLSLEARGITATGSLVILDLQTNKMILRDPELAVGRHRRPVRVAAEEATCVAGSCRLRGVRASACPHRPVGYRIRAESVTIHPSGDIDLTRPVLELEKRPVAALPWLRIRPPRKPGFLAPRLGWDAAGGIVAGPSGWFPLGPSAHAEGHVAARTSQGLESRSRISTPSLDITLEHLLDAPDNYFRARGKGAGRLIAASVALELDVVSGRQIIDDLAASPLDRAKTHTASLGLLSASLGDLVLESGVGFVESFEQSGQIAGDVLAPRATISASLPSTPLLRYFWPSFSTQMTRYGFSSTDRSAAATHTTAPAHTQFEMTYGLEVPARMGVVATTIRGAGRHQAWMADRRPSPGHATHLVSGDATASLPLARTYHLVRHVIEPYGAYRISPWLEGSSPPWILSDADSLRRGQGAELGMLTSMIDRGGMTVLTFDLKERFDLPGFRAEPGPAYIATSAIFGPSWLSLVIDGSWDHDEIEPSTAGASLRSLSNRDRFEIGARWTGPGRGSHRDSPFGDAVGPWFPDLWPREQESQLEILESAHVSITPRLGAFAGLRLGVWPETLLHTLWYGIKLSPTCNCITTAISAAHRPESAIPDVMATLQLTSF